MSVATVVAVGAVAAGAAVAKGIAAKNAAKKAAGAQNSAYDNVEFVDIDKLNSDALSADAKRFDEQFKLQEKTDPTVAGLRKEGASNLLQGLHDDANPNGDANALLKQLTAEGASDSPKREALINQLFDSAQAELNAGATLPPEFQAELVRAGLEKSGAAGTTGSGAADASARTLLGSAGLNLQAQRRSQAEQLLSTADTLKQNRANILAGVLGTNENVLNSKAGRATNAYGIGAAGVPQAGLTGADVANLSVGNTNLKNQVTLGKGGVNANLALAKGAANQEIIGGIASGVTAAAGGIGGGFGGAGGIMGAAGSQNNPRGYQPYQRGTYLA